MTRTLPYPAPWQDAPTLCAHLCISEGTLDNWIKQGLLPPAKQRGGKRYWEWAEVDRLMRGDTGIVPDEADLARRVYNATREAARG